MVIETKEIPIKIGGQCIKCLTCYRACPFEAISIVNFHPEINVELCQLCGICASVCPRHAIEITYYDTESLINYVRIQKETLNTANLVVVCRGSSPPSCEILDVLKSQNMDRFALLRLPCVGRLTAEFYMQALLIGIERIIAIQCEENFCRFEKGSQNNTRNILRVRSMLADLGYADDVVTIIENAPRAIYDTEKCVGCDKCEFICPFGAIKAQPLATPQVDPNLCTGCGACALVCPHLAIQLKGFEYEVLSRTIQESKTRADELKAKGVSPVILVFCCQWSEFSFLDASTSSPWGENVIHIEIPCFGALDPLYILEAFNLGFDGVLTVVCSDDDCKLKEGRGVAEGNASALRKTLGKLGLEARFELFKTSPRDVGSLRSKLDSFIARISSM